MNFIKKIIGFLLKPSTTFNSSKEDSLSDAIKYFIFIALIYSILLTLSIYFTNRFIWIDSLWGGSVYSMMGRSEYLLFPLFFGIGSELYVLWLCTIVEIVKISGRRGFLSGILCILTTPGIFFGFAIFYGIKIIENFPMPLKIIILLIFGVFFSSIIVHIGLRLVCGKKSIEQTIKAVIYGSTPRLIFGWIPFIGIIAEIWSLVLVVIGIRNLQSISTEKAIMALMLLIFGNYSAILETGCRWRKSDYLCL